MDSHLTESRRNYILQVKKEYECESTPSLWEYHSIWNWPHPRSWDYNLLWKLSMFIHTLDTGEESWKPRGSWLFLLHSVFFVSCPVDFPHLRREQFTSWRSSHIILVFPCPRTGKVIEWPTTMSTKLEGQGRTKYPHFSRRVAFYFTEGSDATLSITFDTSNKLHQYWMGSPIVETKSIPAFSSVKNFQSVNQARYSV